MLVLFYFILFYFFILLHFILSNLISFYFNLDGFSNTFGMYLSDVDRRKLAISEGFGKIGSDAISWKRPFFAGAKVDTNTLHSTNGCIYPILIAPHPHPTPARAKSARADKLMALWHSMTQKTKKRKVPICSRTRDHWACHLQVSLAARGGRATPAADDTGATARTPTARVRYVSPNKGKILFSRIWWFSLY